MKFETTYEDAIQRIRKLEIDYTSLGEELNEATTRIRFIDSLFFDCLGWERSDCTTEENYNGEYTDYSFRAPRSMLIVEAKRAGKYFELPVGLKSINQSISTLIRENAAIGEAIKQVAGYCQSRGVPYAAVANGHQLIVFIATRTDMPPLEGRALVFPSLHFMYQNFKDLWEAISKPAVEAKQLEKVLIGTNEVAVPRKLASSITGYPGAKARNLIQTDLQVLGSLVLEDFAKAPEIERLFLQECYETSGAYSQYAIQNKTMLQARYDALFTDERPTITLQPANDKRGISTELLAESISRRPILGSVDILA